MASGKASLHPKKVNCSVSFNSSALLKLNIIERCRTQFPLLNGCNTAADFVRILYEIIATDKSIQTNFVLQMKIYELIYGVALYLNNIDISQDVYIQISNQISGWDKKIFNYWYGDKDTTLSKLLEFESNKRRIVNNVVLNSSDPKVKKLPAYKFLEHHDTDR